MIHTALALVSMLGGVLPSEYPYAGVNAGAPVWGGVIQFGAAKASAIAATGCKTVRINFRLDGHASWDATLLGQYDTIINNAVNNNLEVLGLLSNEIRPEGQSSWNNDSDGDGINQYVIDFSVTAYTLIDRYKTQIKRFEVWNEPDAWTNPNYASDPQNAGGSYLLPRVYCHLLAEVWLQCNQYGGRSILDDYNISLATAGLFAHDIGGSNPSGYFSSVYMTSVYNDGVWNWMEANTPRRYPWDYFGYHFYLSQGTSFSSTQLGQYLTTMQNLKTANNDSSPLLVTEFGWQSTIGETLQANNLRDAYNYMKTRNDIARAYWYQWSNGGTGQWGLLRDDGSHKPSYDEFAAQQTAPPGPTAEFSATPLTGVAPLDVQFTDESTGSITSWSWDFGDEQGSSAPSPLHTYTKIGTFTVALTVSGPDGDDTETKTSYVTIPTVDADLDQDVDVDVADFALFQLCFNGATRPPAPDCSADADYDDDTDVDVADFARFSLCFNGTAQLPACGD